MKVTFHFFFFSIYAAYFLELLGMLKFLSAKESLRSNILVFVMIFFGKVFSILKFNMNFV